MSLLWIMDELIRLSHLNFRTICKLADNHFFINVDPLLYQYKLKAA